MTTAKKTLTKYSTPGQERFCILKLMSLNPKLTYKKQPIILSETQACKTLSYL